MTYKVVASRRRISRLGDTLRVVHDTPYVAAAMLTRNAALAMAEQEAAKDHALDVTVEEES